MPTLRRYIDAHCADPEFRGLFEMSCVICRITVELVARMDRRGLTQAEIAARAGVTPGELAGIVEAERCSCAAVAKLCAFLEVPPPVRCPRA